MIWERHVFLTSLYNYAAWLVLWVCGKCYLRLKYWHACLLSLWVHIHIHGVRSLILYTSGRKQKQKVPLKTLQNSCSNSSQSPPPITNRLVSDCCHEIRFQRNWSPRLCCWFDTLCPDSPQIATWTSYNSQQKQLQGSIVTVHCFQPAFKISSLEMICFINNWLKHIL